MAPAFSDIRNADPSTAVAFTDRTHPSEAISAADDQEQSMQAIEKLLAERKQMAELEVEALKLKMQNSNTSKRISKSGLGRI